MSRQVDNGRSFEFAVAVAVAGNDMSLISPDGSFAVGRQCYARLLELAARDLDQAAQKACNFLREVDPRLQAVSRVSLPFDSGGMKGDVRDIIVNTGSGDVGISTKHHHWAVKHSRLSGTIDFGERWTGCPCSDHYFQSISPVFADLRRLGSEGVLFRDLPGKTSRVYLPILAAFEDELRRLSEDFRDVFVVRLFRYLLGGYDFYKVVMGSSCVSIQSVNLAGSLRWGRKWPIPSRIDVIQRRRESDNTVLVSFAGGWQLSFRLHSARSRVEPSLKFDIQFVGLPQGITSHEIALSQNV